MHAVVITEPGEPEVLRWLEVPDPVPAPARWSSTSPPAASTART